MENNKQNNNILKKIGIIAGITGGIILGIAGIHILLGFGSVGILGGSIAAAIHQQQVMLTALGMTGVFTSSLLYVLFYEVEDLLLV